MNNQLKAFIGHSFDDKDKEIVREFLDYFTELQNLPIGFSWEHAEAAEPIELREKVLRHIEGKNLFIGICTKKESVIDPNNLAETKRNKKIFNAPKEEFSSQTSEWITQEIGLAVGRKMDLILLLENGVRKPGGLQGDLEYIEFERKTPEKSFKKITQMIMALIPTAKAIVVESSEIRTPPVEHIDTKEETLDDELQPRADWDFNKYKIALSISIMKNNKDLVGKIKKSFLSSDFAKELKEKESFEFFEEYCLIRFGKGGDLTKLENLANKSKENIIAQKLLAFAYQQYEDHKRAAILFQSAAEKTSDKNEKLELYGNAIMSFIKSDQNMEVDILIQKMRSGISDVENGELILIDTLCKVAEINKDQDLYLGLNEILLQIKPDKITSRFNLAYRYGEIKQHDLSLFHYLKIPIKDLGGDTWNNLGAEFDYCDLPYKSTKAYQKAEELKSTIAMSNLANKLITIGFLKEAEEICNRAIKYQDCHKNVFDSMLSIRNIPDQEEEKEKPILERVKPLSEFYREYGYASLQSGSDAFSGNWRGPLCELSLKIEDNRLIAIGNYKERTLGVAYLNPQAVGDTPKIKHFNIKYEGQIFGRAVKGVVTKFEKKEEEPRLVNRASSLLAAFEKLSEKKSDILMILCNSLREIKVYEKTAGKDLNFYSLNRID